MLPKIQLIPGAIFEILASAYETGMLTLADRYGLMAACFNEFLQEDEARAVNRLLKAVLKGKIKIADKISSTPND